MAASAATVAVEAMAMEEAAATIAAVVMAVEALAAVAAATAVVAATAWEAVTAVLVIGRAPTVAPMFLRPRIPASAARRRSRRVGAMVNSRMETDELYYICVSITEYDERPMASRLPRRLVSMSSCSP